jgi:restriction endonuclease Mrr
MTLPKYDEFLNPILELLDKTRRVNVGDIKKSLEKQFKPTPDELNERIKIGTPKFYHRIGWAISDLYHAGLI